MAIIGRGATPITLPGGGRACPPGFIQNAVGICTAEGLPGDPRVGAGPVFTGKQPFIVPLTVPHGGNRFQGGFNPGGRSAEQLVSGVSVEDVIRVGGQIVDFVGGLGGNKGQNLGQVGCPPDCPTTTTGDFTPLGQTPAEFSVSGGGGLALPFQTAVNRLQCPTFGNGKIGILWMQPLSGDIVCLPRGVNGRPFGLVRKNKPRRKPLLGAGYGRALREVERGNKVLKRVSKAAGMSCKKK